jgi:hypothetical protein
MRAVADTEPIQEIATDFRKSGVGNVTLARQIDDFLVGDNAVLHHQHAVRQKHRLLDIVGDQEHCTSVALPEFADEFLSLDPGQGIECGEGFIEQQKIGLADQRPRQRGPLRLTTGENLRPLVGAMADTDFFQRFQRPLAISASRKPEHDIAPDGFPRQQARCLEGDRAAMRHFDIAAEFAIKIGEDAQECALAAAARTEQGDEFTGGDIDIQVLQNIS